MSKSQKTQIYIGLLVMGIALVTMAIPFRSQQYTLNVARAIQVTATAALIFGVLRAHPEHKSKFLLFWLVITSIFFTTLIYAVLDYWMHDFRCSNYGYMCIILPWFAAAGIAHMMNSIYNDYVKLTLGPLGSDESIGEPAAAQLPPSYDDTTLDKVTVTTTNA